MPITGVSSRRNNSGELDVFEATQYFSGANDTPFPRHQRTRRMSLDYLPIIKINDPILINSPHDNNPQKQTKDKKKYKQPSSPGARLASFLSSLLNQKKKKSKPVDTKAFDENDQEENPNGRRKRRNSISHIFITSSKTGFENPNPGYAKTPTKPCNKEFNVLCDPKKVDDLLLENSGKLKPTIQNEIFGGKSGKDYAWIEEKCELKNGVLEKNGSFGYSSEEFKKSSDEDSDSSSDLFDLPNHEMDFYSSDLPVYETTHLGRIKIGN